MEIAENITWTEELERLDVLLSQGQFELLLPGERYGGGEKAAKRLIYEEFR